MLAQSYVAQTHGLFDPSILPDLQRIGYDRTMDLIRAEGAIASREIPIMSIRQRVPLNGLTVNSEENLIYLPAGTMLDLGGIAKGWIAEQAAGVLAEYSPACAVNAGGDIFLVGLPEAETGWQIALEDPRTPDVALAMLHIPPGAIATSSITRRTWMQNEKQRHHLIDPRTGEPAITDWLSVTVVSPHADLSEVFAKALLIAGPQNAEIISQAETEIAYLAVNRDGQIVGTKKSLEYIV
jgi:FAD:protein FMN transferase